jgi:hypothetical protein
MELFVIKNLRTNRYYHDTILTTDIWGFIACAMRMRYETARAWAKVLQAEGQVVDIVRVS